MPRKRPSATSPETVKAIATELCALEQETGDDYPIDFSNYLSAMETDDTLTSTDRKEIAKLLNAINDVKAHGKAGKYQDVLKRSLVTLKMITDNLRGDIPSERVRLGDESPVQAYVRNDLQKEIDYIEKDIIPKMQELATALNIELAEPGQGAAR